MTPWVIGHIGHRSHGSWLTWVILKGFRVQYTGWVVVVGRFGRPIFQALKKLFLPHITVPNKQEFQQEVVRLLFDDSRRQWIWSHGHTVVETINPLVSDAVNYHKSRDNILDINQATKTNTFLVGKIGHGKGRSGWGQRQGHVLLKIHTNNLAL